MTFQQLPQAALESVFNYLDLSDVSSLGRECRSFREAAKSILYAALKRILKDVGLEMKRIKSKALVISNGFPESLQDSKAFLQLALHFTVVKMFQSELQMLETCCWRYMRNPRYDFCFPAGDLLDEYSFAIALVHDEGLTKEIEPDITTRLFNRTEKFLELFEATIEPGLTRQPAFGVKILDILDCSQTSNSQVKLSSRHDQRNLLLIQGKYEMSNGTVERFVETDKRPTSKQRMKLIVKYLRNQVRWNNLFHELVELWDLEDAFDNINRDDHTLFYRQYKHFFTESPRIPHLYDDVADKFVSSIDHLFDQTTPDEDIVAPTLRHVIQEEPAAPRKEVFVRKQNLTQNRFGIVCEITLQSPELPLSLEIMKEKNAKDLKSDVLEEHSCVDISPCESVEYDYYNDLFLSEEVVLPLLEECLSRATSNHLIKSDSRESEPSSRVQISAYSNLNISTVVNVDLQNSGQPNDFTISLADSSSDRGPTLFLQARSPVEGSATPSPTDSSREQMLWHEILTTGVKKEMKGRDFQMVMTIRTPSLSRENIVKENKIAVHYSYDAERVVTVVDNDNSNSFVN